MVRVPRRTHFRRSRSIPTLRVRARKDRGTGSASLMRASMPIPRNLPAAHPPLRPRSEPRPRTPPQRRRGDTRPAGRRRRGDTQAAGFPTPVLPTTGQTNRGVGNPSPSACRVSVSSRFGPERCGGSGNAAGASVSCRVVWCGVVWCAFRAFHDIRAGRGPVATAPFRARADDSIAPAAFPHPTHRSEPAGRRPSRADRNSTADAPSRARDPTTQPRRPQLHSRRTVPSPQADDPAAFPSTVETHPNHAATAPIPAATRGNRTVLPTMPSCRDTKIGGRLLSRRCRRSGETRCRGSSETGAPARRRPAWRHAGRRISDTSAADDRSNRPWRRKSKPIGVSRKRVAAARNSPTKPRPRQLSIRATEPDRRDLTPDTSAADGQPNRRWRRESEPIGVSRKHAAAPGPDWHDGSGNAPGAIEPSAPRPEATTESQAPYTPNGPESASKTYRTSRVLKPAQHRGVFTLG